jgi:formylmethanofuran dehydrogenase subunit B
LEARIESAICPGCACLCDDIDLTLVDGRIDQAANICLWGAGKLFSQKRFHPKKSRRRLCEPQLKHRGLWETVTYEAAVARTAEILGQARRPVIYGLTNSGSWAQAAALDLARRARARLEPADLAFKAPYYQSLIKYGLYWAPLEVIRDEADTVVFWGANPLHSCPRHVVRYAMFARGKFTERGIEERRLAAVDLHRTELAGLVHLFLEIDPNEELALLQGLLDTALLDGLARLAARLNEQGPCILFPLSTDFNSAGLYHLLLRELGTPFAPDFSAGSGFAAHAAPVDWADVDALVVVGADLFWFLSAAEMNDLKARRVPVVVLSPFANRSAGHADVVFPVALAGVETPEVAYRMDGLPLNLPGIVPSPRWSDSQVLRAVTDAL